MTENQPPNAKRDKQPRKIPPDNLRDRLGGAAIWLTVGSVMAVAGGAVALGLSIRSGIHNLQDKRSADINTPEE